MQCQESDRRCVVCAEILSTANDSKEHVIPEAIGGRLKTRGFICKKCNSNAGHTWDAKLASQLQPLSLMFGVCRQRGSTPPLSMTTTAGEDLTIWPDGKLVPAKPSFVEDVTSEGVKVQIAARSMGEAKRILAGIKRKYPHIDVEQILASAAVSHSYPQGLMHHKLDFGGEISGRSVVKSALALLHHFGMPTEMCGEALAYLRDSAATPCFGYYYASDLVSGRPAEMPLHCISFEANPETGLILGYAEYFGAYRIVLCMGREYMGDPLHAHYAVDPRTGSEIDISVRIGFTEDEISAIYDYKMIPEGAIEKAFANVIPAALRSKFEDEKNRVIAEATDYAFANCGAKPGEILSEEHVSKLSQLMMEKLTPFILHHVARRH